MSHKGKIAIGAAIGLLIVVASAHALANFSLTLGTIANYDFGRDGGYVPGTVQIHAFMMKPGDSIPWHYHKALSYVVLVRGTLTETHVGADGACASEEFTSGSAFVEQPDQVHTVSNTGNDDAVIWWATAFPKSDGITEFTPALRAGGIYPPNPTPTCAP